MTASLPIPDEPAPDTAGDSSAEPAAEASDDTSKRPPRTSANGASKAAAPRTPRPKAAGAKTPAKRTPAPRKTSSTAKGGAGRTPARTSGAKSTTARKSTPARTPKPVEAPEPPAAPGDAIAEAIPGPPPPLPVDLVIPPRPPLPEEVAEPVAAEPQPEPEPEPEQAPEPESAPIVEPEPEPEPEPQQLAASESDLLPEAIVELEPESAPEPVVELEPESAPEPVVEPEFVAEPVTEPETELVVEPEPEPEPIVEAEPAPAVVVESGQDAGTDVAEPALRLRAVTKTFGETRAVDAIDLTVPAGSFYGLVGPNGAGKTTTLSMIAGLLRPDGGSISVGGVDSATHPQQAKRRMGVLPDRLRTFDRLTGRQLLYYYGVLRGLSSAVVESRTADLARAFDLVDALGRSVSDYSAGMTKKVMLAGAMIHSPRLLVLDEPFESVDPVSSAVILDILTTYVDHGGTVILSSHGMELVERVCSRVAVLVAGQVLAEGTVDEVRGESTLEERFIELAGGLGDLEGLEWLHTFSD